MATVDVAVARNPLISLCLACTLCLVRGGCWFQAEPVEEPEPTAAPSLSLAEVNKMTVPKLKAALTELGLDTTGLKAVLKQRLLDAL